MDVALGAPAELLALDAWRTLSPGAAEPSKVVTVKVKKRGRGSIHRLIGAGPGGTDILAKRTHAHGAALETEIYERVLPLLPLRSATFFGSVPEQESDLCWLFFENVSGEPMAELSNPAVAEWLAGLHAAASAQPRPAGVPSKELGYYLEIVHSSKKQIAESLDYDELDAVQRDWLTGTLEELDYLEAFWGDVVEACAGLPETLVHGDVEPKNLILGADGEIVAVDWESAGWGVPALDFRDVDARSYHAAVGAHWPELTLEAIERAAAVGTVLEVIGTTRGIAAGLPAQPVVRRLSNRRSKLVRALRAAGWG